MKQKVNTHREIYFFFTKRVFIYTYIIQIGNSQNQKDMPECIWKYTNIYYTDINELSGYIFILPSDSEPETDTGSKIGGYDKHENK